MADKNLLPIRGRHSHSNKHIKSPSREVKYWLLRLVRTPSRLDYNFSPDHRHSYQSGESQECSDTPLRICEHRPLNGALLYALKTLEGLIVSTKYTPYCKTFDCNEIQGIRRHFAGKTARENDRDN